MKFISKYKELINSPEIIEYIGNSKKRKFLVNSITGFVVVVLLLIAVLLGTVLGLVLFNYLS